MNGSYITNYAIKAYPKAKGFEEMTYEYIDENIECSYIPENSNVEVKYSGKSTKDGSPILEVITTKFTTILNKKFISSIGSSLDKVKKNRVYFVIERDFNGKAEKIESIKTIEPEDKGE